MSVSSGRRAQAAAGRRVCDCGRPEEWHYMSSSPLSLGDGVCTGGTVFLPSHIPARLLVRLGHKQFFAPMVDQRAVSCMTAAGAFVRPGFGGATWFWRVGDISGRYRGHRGQQ